MFGVAYELSETALKTDMFCNFSWYVPSEVLKAGLIDEQLGRTEDNELHYRIKSRI